MADKPRLHNVPAHSGMVATDGDGNQWIDIRREDGSTGWLCLGDGREVESTGALLELCEDRLREQRDLPPCDCGDGLDCPEITLTLMCAEEIGG